jgi:hypothetical protein
VSRPRRCLDPLGHAHCLVWAVASWLAVFFWCDLSAGDVVWPPPEDCPPGHTPRTRHMLPYCEPPPPRPCPRGSFWMSFGPRPGESFCARRACDACPTAADCLDASLCIREREIPGGRSGSLVEEVTGVCRRSGDCPTGGKCAYGKHCPLQPRQYLTSVRRAPTGDASTAPPDAAIDADHGDAVRPTEGVSPGAPEHSDTDQGRQPGLVPWVVLVALLATALGTLGAAVRGPARRSSDKDAPLE